MFNSLIEDLKRHSIGCEIIGDGGDQFIAIDSSNMVIECNSYLNGVAYTLLDDHYTYGTLCSETTLIAPLKLKDFEQVFITVVLAYLED